MPKAGARENPGDPGQASEYPPDPSMRPRVLVIDNYDSFVYNLVQYLGELGSEPIVHRHDALSLDETLELDPDAILISPGPGTPDDAGLSTAVITAFAGRRPVLGVCLGHQCLGQAFGGK